MVATSTRDLYLAARVLTQSAVGSMIKKVVTTVSTAIRMLSQSAGRKSGSPNMSNKPSSVHRLRIVSRPSSATGTRWKANLAMAIIGSAKKIVALVTTSQAQIGDFPRDLIAATARHDGEARDRRPW
jgi:hypothetical protein